MLSGCGSLETKFRRADADHDNKLSREEFSDGVAKLAFKRYDANADSIVTLAEWQAVEGTDSDRKFTLRDTSHDGKVTATEAQTVARKNGGFSKLFDEVDAYTDSQIDLAEAKAYAKAQPAKKN